MDRWEEAAPGVQAHRRAAIGCGRARSAVAGDGRRRGTCCDGLRAPSRPASTSHDEPATLARSSRRDARGEEGEGGRRCRRRACVGGEREIERAKRREERKRRRISNV